MDIESDVKNTLESIRDGCIYGDGIETTDRILMNTYEDEAMRVAEIDKVNAKIDSASDKIGKLSEKALEERKNAVGGHERREIGQKRERIEELYQQAVTYHSQLENSLNEVILPSVEMIDMIQEEYIN